MSRYKAENALRDYRGLPPAYGEETFADEGQELERLAESCELTHEVIDG